MSNKAPKDLRQQALCGQADAIFDILVRNGNLPSKLSLSIEEILEGAWEIAYHRDTPGPGGNLITLADFRACRRPQPDGEKGNVVHIARRTEPH